MPKKASSKTPQSPKAALAGSRSRAERTRALIRDAANRLFLEKGVEQTTVDAIVAAAGVYLPPPLVAWFQYVAGLLG